MKDKRAKQMTQRDLLEQYKNEDPMEKQIYSQMSTLEEEVMTEEQIEAIKNYNENVFNSATEQYKSLKPMTDVLVRVKVNEPRVTEKGLIASNKLYIPLPTQSGVGNLGVMENPYPYSRVAVVIAKPDTVSQIEVGDVVFLSNSPVEGRLTGKGKDAEVVIPKGFVHPLSKTFRLPTDFTNEHFGYLLVPFYEIQMVLGKS